MWVYTDMWGRVLAANQGDMSGNSGWSEVAACPDEIMNAGGFALYKLDDGVVVERTAEEIAGDELNAGQEVAAISDRQRLDEIEAALIELAELLGGGL